MSFRGAQEQSVAVGSPEVSIPYKEVERYRFRDFYDVSMPHAFLDLGRHLGTFYVSSLHTHDTYIPRTFSSAGSYYDYICLEFVHHYIVLLEVSNTVRYSEFISIVSVAKLVLVLIPLYIFGFLSPFIFIDLHLPRSQRASQILDRGSRQPSREHMPRMHPAVRSDPLVHQ